MMEEWITRKSPEYRELQEKALAALERIEAMIETLPSQLHAETHLTGEEVRNLFGLSPFPSWDPMGWASNWEMISSVNRFLMVRF